MAETNEAIHYAMTLIEKTGLDLDQKQRPRHVQMEFRAPNGRGALVITVPFHKAKRFEIGDTVAVDVPIPAEDD